MFLKRWGFVALSASTPPRQQMRPQGDRRWVLAAVGLLVLALSHPLLWHGAQRELWFAPLGLGLVLTAWLGLRVVPLIFGVFCLTNLALRSPDVHVLQAVASAFLLSAEIALAWWCYHDRADGSRCLDDPRSATLFLLLVPGLLAAVFAGLDALVRHGFSLDDGYGRLTLDLWIDQALGLLALPPMLLMIATPWLVYYRLAPPDSVNQPYMTHPRLSWSVGELLEMIGLALGAAVLGGALANLHAKEAPMNWHLWGLLLLVIVWASLRLGLRGGSLVAGAATTFALSIAAMLTDDKALLMPLRGNLLAQCSTALLVGASADWIRASEARYRQVVGHIPVMLYSARFLRQPTPGKIPEVVILLVSQAARQIMRCEPEMLVGSYHNWRDRIEASDRELVQAALSQLIMQKQPVTCEYRIIGKDLPAAEGSPEKSAAIFQGLLRGPGVATERWVRDRLVPHLGPDQQIDGWEGVVEDITEQRLLAHDLRRTTNMLHALVAHLPTGVFFVHGLHGQPLLVNARARQLLGQREDLAAGVNHLPSVYRLYRPDGKMYPSEELPVYQALRHGATCMRDDIVVHRPDGRRIPLVTWAAPVNLGNEGEHDAAVWVLEDLSALRQAEAARQETELRLRVVVETMAEGLVVQNHNGLIVECNPAACAILGASNEQLRRATSLGLDGTCVDENGTQLDRDGQPDRVVLRTGQPVRNMILGIRMPSPPEHNRDRVPEIRWILANSMPVSVSDKPGDKRGQRCVTTFADITAHRKAQEVLRHSEEQYRELVETLPMMLLRFAADDSVSYLNPAAEEITGFPAADLRRQGFWQERIHSDDRPAFAALLENTRAGQTCRQEFRYSAADGSEKVGYALAQPRRPGGTTVLVLDMTHRRRMEQELQKVQRLELVARIASGVVHDFNNLLAVIVSYAEMAKEALVDHPAVRDLEQVTEACGQAARLAGQLLTFSKQRQVVMRPLDLNAAVDRALQLLGPALPPNIEVAWQRAAEEAWVLADDGPLQQVVMNLCLNARDAMPQGGRLSVQTALVDLPPGDATVAAAVGATGGVRRWVRLSAEDTGSGMDQATQARIFEALFTTKERGSGLGLAVVKQIVEGFGGCIHVTSAPGQGARFDIWLPSSK